MDSSNHNEPKYEKTQTEREATLIRLSKLSPVEYDLVRKSVAKGFGIRESTLDDEISRRRDTKTPNSGIQDIESFAEDVNPEELLNEIFDLIKRFIICDEPTATAATLWIAFTWFIDCFDVAPIANISAPEKRCGKSQLLFLIGRLCKRSLPTSNISSAALYRSIEAWNPTLIIDEADAFMRDNEELRGIINSGHTRESAFVIRVTGDEHVPAKFSTWAAKAIAGIGHLSETILDRSIVLTLRRKLSSETVERLRQADKSEFHVLSQKLSRFYDDYSYKVKATRVSLPFELNDRAQDNWEPLLAIAHVVDGAWPKRAYAAALKLNQAEEPAPSTKVELLGDIRDVFEETVIEVFSTKDLLGKLLENEEAPWSTYNRGNPLSVRQLITKLRDFKIEPKQLRKIGRARGYRASDFTEAWSRYLASGKIGETAGQESNSNNLNVTPASPSHVTRAPHVTEKDANPLNSLRRHVVTPVLPGGSR